MAPLRRDVWLAWLVPAAARVASGEGAWGDCISMLQQARSVDLAASTEGAICPEGYRVVAGDVPGWDQFGRDMGNRKDTIGLCAADCNGRPDCLSFEWSARTTICSLNKARYPQLDSFEDYTFCQRTGDVSMGPQGVAHDSKGANLGTVDNVTIGGDDLGNAPLLGQALNLASIRESANFHTESERQDFKTEASQLAKADMEVTQRAEASKEVNQRAEDDAQRIKAEKEALKEASHSTKANDEAGQSAEADKKAIGNEAGNETGRSQESGQGIKAEEKPIQNDFESSQKWEPGSKAGQKTEANQEADQSAKTDAEATQTSETPQRAEAHQDANPNAEPDGQAMKARETNTEASQEGVAGNEVDAAKESNQATEAEVREGTTQEIKSKEVSLKAQVESELNQTTKADVEASQGATASSMASQKKESDAEADPKKEAAAEPEAVSTLGTSEDRDHNKVETASDDVEAKHVSMEDVAVLKQTPADDGQKEISRKEAGDTHPTQSEHEQDVLRQEDDANRKLVEEAEAMLRRRVEESEAELRSLAEEQDGTLEDAKLRRAKEKADSQAMALGLEMKGKVEEALKVYREKGLLSASFEEDMLNMLVDQVAHGTAEQFLHNATAEGQPDPLATPENPGQNLPHESQDMHEDEGELSHTSCPPGFQYLHGDVAGWDQFGRGRTNRVDSLQECLKDCTERPNCLSFEWSPTSKICSLNKVASPSTLVPYQDYFFCQRKELDQANLMEGALQRVANKTQQKTSSENIDQSSSQLFQESRGTATPQRAAEQQMAEPPTTEEQEEQQHEPPVDPVPLAAAEQKPTQPHEQKAVEDHEVSTSDEEQQQEPPKEQQHEPEGPSDAHNPEDSLLLEAAEQKPAQPLERKAVEDHHVGNSDEEEQREPPEQQHEPEGPSETDDPEGPLLLAAAEKRPAQPLEREAIEGHDVGMGDEEQQQEPPEEEQHEPKVPSDTHDPEDHDVGTSDEEQQHEPPEEQQHETDGLSDTHDPKDHNAGTTDQEPALSIQGPDLALKQKADVTLNVEPRTHPASSSVEYLWEQEAQRREAPAKQMAPKGAQRGGVLLRLKKAMEEDTKKKAEEAELQLQEQERELDALKEERDEAERQLKRQKDAESKKQEELNKVIAEWTPGKYQIILDDVAVSPTAGRSRTKLSYLAAGTEIVVTEVSKGLVDGRIRARLASPAGWISLYHPGSNIRFAAKVTE